MVDVEVNVSLEFDESHAEFAEHVRRFAMRHLADGALARAHSDTYPWETARLLAENGLLGLTVAEADGGQGASLLDAVIALHEIGRVCPKSADVVQAGSFGAIRTFVEYATDAQKQRWLPALLRGDGLLAVGMSEPEAGTGLTGLNTTATEDGDDVVIDGTKIWCTHSVDATLFLVYVRFGPGIDGIGSVIIERDTAGLTIGPPSTYMSGERWAPLVFDQCRVPRSHVLLGPGGFKRQIQGFNVERLGNATRSVAVGRLAMDAAVEFLRMRQQGGRALAELQGLQWYVAEAEVELQAAESLISRAARRAGSKLPSAFDTAIAKYAANKAGFEATSVAVQLMGAQGYSSETVVEYCFRRARGWMIAGGSLEVLKNRIAREVLGARQAEEVGAA